MNPGKVDQLSVIPRSTALPPLLGAINAGVLMDLLPHIRTPSGVATAFGHMRVFLQVKIFSAHYYYAKYEKPTKKLKIALKYAS